MNGVIGNIIEAGVDVLKVVWCQRFRFGTFLGKTIPNGSGRDQQRLLSLRLEKNRHGET